MMVIGWVLKLGKEQSAHSIEKLMWSDGDVEYELDKQKV